MSHLFSAWNGLHPIIVHFPVILLLVAPVLVILGSFLPEAHRGPFLGYALTLMVLGTGMTYVAVATGEAATKSVVCRPALSEPLQEHRSLAATTSELFSVITPVFALLLLAHRLLRGKLEAWVRTSLFAAFLLFYGTGAVLLVDTALKGSRLVKVLGSPWAVSSSLPGKGGR